MIGFTPQLGGNVILSVTATTSSTALPTAGGKNIHVVNKGAAMAFVRLGSSAVIATDGDFPLARSSSATLTRALENDTHIAAVCNASEGTIVHAIAGEGDPNAG